MGQRQCVKCGDHPATVCRTCVKAMRESVIPSTALLDAAQLLDDCLIRIYPEEFTKEHQEAAAKRFWEHNGTISRIADMADKLRRASNAEVDRQEEAGQ